MTDMNEISTETTEKHPIEQRIIERAYSSPNTARAGVRRSQLPKKEQARMMELIDAWEKDQPPEDVVMSGVPEIPTSNGSAKKGRSKSEPALPVRVNLNTRVRAHLTLQGAAQLWSARDSILIPQSVLDGSRIWECQLWEFMAAMGRSMSCGADASTVSNEIEILGMP